MSDNRTRTAGRGGWCPRAVRTAAALWRTGGWRAVWRRSRLRLGWRLPATTRLVESSAAGIDRLTVYSAAFGRHDPPRPVTPVAGVQFVCFSDRAAAAPPRGWQWRNVGPLDADPVRSARRVKALPHRFLPDAACSIWLDADVQLACDPSLLAATVLAKADFASFAHPERDCAYCEAEWVAHLGLDDRPRIAAQMARYRRLGLPTKCGLWETALVVRRHAATSALNECWADEIQRGSRRDQLSLPFALRQFPLRCCAIPGGREESSLVEYQVA